MTNACKKRGVCVSGELGDSSTVSEVEESRLSEKDGVTSIPTCEHQSSYEVKAESMNTRMKRRCTEILRKLMNCKGGWIFNQPVDPVLYGLPDYFDVIRNLMDLGTVKKKLTNKQYVSTDEFVADVRLTFSNAMKYNPPGNDVHAIAQQLNRIFDLLWQSVKKKFRVPSPVQEQKTILTKACKKRRGVCVSSELGVSSTVFEAEESRLSKKNAVTPIPTCQHQSSYEFKAESMNTWKIRLCGNIVRMLIDCKGGWLFKDPVDPVLFGIPDYFDVIRNPMDLGTVKNKLTKKKYVSIEEFAADVRLTFSNAMKYNPPGNDVHTYAKELNEIFDSEWESVEKKFRCRNPVQEQQTMKAIKVRAIMDSKSTVAKGSVACSNPKPLVARGPVACSNLIAKKTLTDALSSKVKIKFSVRSSAHTSSKDIPVQAAGSKEGTLNHSVPTGNKEASLNCTLPIAKENAKISRTRETERSSRSIGKESWSCNDTSTSPLASSVQAEEGYLHDEPLSPSRALRAAMLRSRFAGTIVKAQQKALLDHGKNIDPVKLQLEKERLEKRQQEEKARIEAQVKAAEEAAQLKFEEEMRMQREREREAARLALRMMKKTVDIDNSDFLKELENFSKMQSSPPGKLIVDFIDGDLPPGLGSPLERLGLFMKNDFEDEVEQEMEDSASPSMDVDMRKDFQEDAGHEMEDSVSPVTVIGMKNDLKGAEVHEMEDSLSPSTAIDTKKDSGHEMEDSVSPSTVIDTKKDSEEDREHEMVDSVSPLMDVDTEEGEISC